MKKTFAVTAIAAVLVTLFVSLAFGGDFRDKADRFMKNLTTEKFDSAAVDFAPEVAAQLSPGILNQVWTGVVAQLGGFKGFTFNKYLQADTTMTYIYTVAFNQMDLLALVSYNPSGKVNGFYFRQVEPADQKKPAYRIPPYVDTTKFSEAEIVVPGVSPVPAARVTAGIGHPAPVVLLVPGSGQNDRNETIGNNQPFKDIAWGLGTLGISSVRFDNRSYVVGMERTAELDLNGYLLDDIAACLKYICSEPTLFDTSKIIILGHSLGGIVAPVVAKRDGGLAGIIMMSASARPVYDIVVSQYEYLGSLEPDNVQDLFKAQIAAVRETCGKIKNRTFPRDQMFIFASGKVWYDLMDNDNVVAAKGLSIPMLLLHGGRDYQVTDADWQIWNQTLGGRPNVVFKRYDNLNHLYQPGDGMAHNTEYTTNLAPMDRQVLVDIADWIKGFGR
ncbi:MAG: DUF3887 domain-containing protein [candidate division Zixibacteria bacterium]|nr:DUF3887 domain-containing protein [candidate division Zixibacteria bacterium]